MTLSEAKEIADSPEGRSDVQLRQALDRLRNSEDAGSRLERHISRLNIAITSNLIRTDV